MNLSDFPDDAQGPEELLLAQERTEILRRSLAALSRQQRDILIRFYLKGESKEDILEDTGLTEVQFRNAKNRAKDRLGVIGRSMKGAKARSAVA